MKISNEADQPNDTEALSLLTLPRHIRLEIFRQTDLVAPLSFQPGAVIENGELLRYDQRINFPTALLAVSHQIREEALTVFFLHNRIILSGHLNESLAFLELFVKTPLLRLIRNLDVRLLNFDDALYVDQFPSPEDLLEELPEFIEFISEHLDLPRLHLSLDAGRCHLDFVEHIGDDLHQLRAVRRAYRAVAKRLIPLRGKGLKKFHVFLACDFGFESEFEKMVMGEDYHAEGKVPHRNRKRLFPHEPGIPDGGMVYLEGPGSDLGDDVDDEEYGQEAYRWMHDDGDGSWDGEAGEDEGSEGSWVDEEDEGEEDEEEDEEDG
ncbi:hypothetical protein BC829DRAFT_393437 [Chytridium lagenaria]|nr:hypothetical protein BC829DRAFT_393437 [Chytridium lagenaria]